MGGVYLNKQKQKGKIYQLVDLRYTTYFNLIKSRPRPIEVYIMHIIGRSWNVLLPRAEKCYFKTM